MAKVSVPEKTLEHWSSLYLAYRYRSLASMWWPVTGADIDVRWFPAQPGKAVQLELKTTVVAGTHLQDVVVNLGQLWQYSKRALAKQPFYVFPWPDWTGDLESVAILNGKTPTELAYSRSGPDWWFAEWMVVLTTAQVAKVLAAELSAHGSPNRKGASCRLVRFDLSVATSAPTRIWGAHAAEPLAIPWRQFWADLQTCGRDRWPQLIRLPADLVNQATYSREEISELLSYSPQFVREAKNRNLELMTLAPSENIAAGEPDVFVAVREDSGGGGDLLVADRVRSRDADRRQAVFINAGAVDLAPKRGAQAEATG